METFGGKFRFIHKLVQDFFKVDHARQHDSPEISRLSELFRPTSFEAHCVLNTMCLSYLLFYTPSPPFSDNMLQSAKKNDIFSAFPIIEYAVCHWISHLEP